MRQHAAQASGDRGGRSSLGAALLLVPCAFLAWLVVPVLAQSPPSPRIFYTREREFRIPFETDPNERRISSVRLHASDNMGQSWQHVATAQPGGQAAFNFTAERDGWYWFTVQTVDQEKRLYPPVVDSQTPVQLKVCVDTQKPVITLHTVPAGEGNVGITWAIQDDNLNNFRQNKPDALVLEYRSPGGQSWSRISAEQRPVGQRIWAPDASPPLEVRLRVQDDAGNEGQASLAIGAGGKALSSSDGTGGASPRTGNEKRRLVNKRRINMNYGVEDLGGSGLKVVELWSFDGKSWKKESEEESPKPPYVYKIELQEEGVYGFTLIARSGVGLGEPPPRIGDLPQLWLEADWTPPKVAIQGVKVGEGPDTGSLFITYTAEDKNLEREGAVTLSYAERPDGTWTAFAKNQDNRGRYVWRMPRDVPWQFYVRVEAADRAGNVGKAETSEPVKVDLKRPRARVLTIDLGDEP
jgi:hypothetical protein